MKTDVIMRKLHRIFAMMGMGPFMLVLVVTGSWMLVRPCCCADAAPSRSEVHDKSGAGRLPADGPAHAPR